MITMLLGTIYGFVLYLGPIIWGLIGLIGGIIITVPIDFFYKKGKHKRGLRKDKAEVIIIIHCREENAELIESILYHHHTIGVVRI